MIFKVQLWNEYPIPRDVSIWGGDGIDSTPVGDLDSLIETSVSDLASDILLNGSITCYSQANTMPEGTVSVISAKLSSPYNFQGNRYIKFNYDVDTLTLYLRYYPAFVTYKKELTVNDLNSLKGDRLIYVKSYIFWKMADKELAIMKSVNFSADNVTLEFSMLTDFRDRSRATYESLKPEILIYTSQP